MLNKKWSSLDDERKTGGQKRGHFGEYFAEMQFMLHGFEVYNTIWSLHGRWAIYFGH